MTPRLWIAIIVIMAATIALSRPSVSRGRPSSVTTFYTPVTFKGAVTMNSTCTGCPIPTLVLRQGNLSGAPYTDTNTKFVWTTVDSTLLAFTKTIPVGQKAVYWCSFDWEIGAGSPINVVAGFRLFDTSTSKVLSSKSWELENSEASNRLDYPVTIFGQLVGDGASHTVQLQYAYWASSASASLLIKNSTSETPECLMELTQAN